jgi:hypothetical protein
LLLEALLTLLDIEIAPAIMDAAVFDWQLLKRLPPTVTTAVLATTAIISIVGSCPAVAHLRHCSI